MRAGAECESWIEPYDDGIWVVRQFGRRGAHPKPSPEAHRFPVGEPPALPFLVFASTPPRGLRDVRPQDGGESTEIACRVQGHGVRGCGAGRFLEQGADQRVAPQSDFAWLGLEHGLIAAIDVGDRTRSDLEKRSLDQAFAQGREREFDLIERHRCNTRWMLLQSQASL